MAPCRVRDPMSRPHTELLYPFEEPRVPPHLRRRIAVTQVMQSGFDTSKNQHTPSSFRSLLVLVLVFIFIMFAVRQCAAIALTPITRKRSQKVEETKGTHTLFFTVSFIYIFFFLPLSLLFKIVWFTALCMPRDLRSVRVVWHYMAKSPYRVWDANVCFVVFAYYMHVKSARTRIVVP